MTVSGKIGVSAFVGLTVIFYGAGFSIPGNTGPARIGGLVAINTTVAMAKNKKISRDGEAEARGFMNNTDAFGMKNEEYFVSPFKNFDSVGDRLVDEEFDGLVIGGPTYIPIEKAKSFPIVALRVTEAMESSRHLFKEFALVSAMDLHSEKLYAQHFVEQKFVKIARDLEKDPPPPGRVSDGGSADLFSRLRIPNQIGEYLVTVILLDKISNRIRVRIGPSEVEADDKKFIAAMNKSRPKSIHNETRLGAKRLFSTVQESKSPAVPKELGIALQAESHWKPKDKSGVVTLYGSYNIETTAIHAQESGLDSVIPTGKVLPISLLATGSRVSAPLIWEIAIPLENGIRGDDRESRRGFFAVNLDSMDGLEENQTYLIRAFTGEWISGPIELNLEAKER